MPLLERTKLYKDVWSRPCTKIAAELGISSSALKRICTEMDIPTPVAGYWTRVQCGKKVSKEALGLRFRCNQDLPEARNSRRGYLHHHEKKMLPICWVEACGEKVPFVIKEKRRREKVADPEELKRLWGRAWKDVPTGILEFTIDGGWVMGQKAIWIDGKGQRIENHLAQMVALIPLAGEENKNQRLRWEQERQRQERLAEQEAWMDTVREKEEKAIEMRTMRRTRIPPTHGKVVEFFLSTGPQKRTAYS